MSEQGIAAPSADAIASALVRDAAEWSRDNRSCGRGEWLIFQTGALRERIAALVRAERSREASGAEPAIHVRAPEGA